MKGVGRRVWIWAVGIPTAFLLAVLILAWVALSTQWGARTVWTLVQGRLPAGLQVQEVRGRLRSPLEFRGLVFQTPGARVEVDRISLEWSLLPLLRKTLSVNRIDVDEVRVAVAPAEAGEEVPGPSQLPSVTLPLQLVLEEGSVGSVSFTRGVEGGEARRLEKIALQALTFRDRLEFRRLELTAPQGTFGLSGQVQTQEDYPFELEVGGVVNLPDGPPWEGHLSLSGDLRRTTALAVIKAPMAAELSVSVLEPRGDLTFDARVSLPDADARVIRQDWPEVRIGGTVFASGNPDSIRAEGALLVDMPLTGPTAVEGVVHWAGSALQVEAVHATNQGSHLDARGRVNLAEGEPGVDLNLSWRDLRWPLTGLPDYDLEEGRMALRGTLAAYRMTLNGVGSRRADGLSARFSLRGRGNTERLWLEEFSTPALGGEIGAAGEVAWAPRVRWDLRIAGDGLNPSSLMADSSQWVGSLDVRLRTDGELRPQGPVGRVSLEALSGVLRGGEVSARGEGRYALSSRRPAGRAPMPQVTLDSFGLDWGPNHLSAVGIFGDSVDVDLQLSAPDLGLFLPGGAGALEVTAGLGGERFEPRITLDMTARDVAYGERSLAFLDLEGDVDSSVRGLVALGGVAHGVGLGGGEILDTVTLDLRGTMETHRLSTGFSGPRGSGDLVAEGGVEDRVWRGVLEANSLRVEPWGEWTLEGPGRLELSGSAAILEESCWRSAPARFCAGGRWEAMGATELSASVRGLDLHRFESSLPEGWTLVGDLSSDAWIHLSQDRALLARAEGDISSLRMEYPADAERHELVFSEIRLEASADEGGLRVESVMRVAVEGTADIADLQALMEVPGLTHLGVDLPSQPVTGSLQARITDFSAVEALVPELEALTARLDVDVDLGGTVGSPVLQGEARLTEGSVDLPALGLGLRDIQVVARGEGEEGVRVEGRVRSGNGSMEITGRMPLVPTLSNPARLSLRGTDLTAADLPEVGIWVSPDIQVTAAPEDVEVTGQITIPRARIELTELPTSAVPPSKDVVFVEDSVSAAGSGPAVRTSVRIVLGDSVSFQGFGFSARPQGSILATDEPGRATTGTGELILTGGRYRAYGQDLSVQRGRILFAGGPIDNPGLDIRATRTARDGTVAGLDIAGTLRYPEVTLFSEPAMMQSEALAYLILGHPLGSASTSEGSRVAGAAASLGLKGGNLLASRIGQRFGLSEVSIEAEGPLEEAALVAGKYLSPRLYVSYGVGLFEPINTFRLRYMLSSRWTLQAESGKAAGADALYRIERGR